MTATAQAHSGESKANGATMRATPLAIWGVHLSDEDLDQAARTDAALTHPNPTCLYANTAYVLACRHLLRHRGDNVGAFERAEKYVVSRNGEVAGWLNDARHGVFPDTQHIGWIAIAFVHAFYHLLHGTPYPEAIRAVVSIGGDTDTNAAIVGGLIGALHGISQIPRDLVTRVVQCDTRHAGRYRPQWLQASPSSEHHPTSHTRPLLAPSRGTRAGGSLAWCRAF